jgi:hypothetical protein
MPPTDPVMLLNILMLMGLLGGICIWSRLRTANSQLHRENREISRSFGHDFPPDVGQRDDFLQHRLAPGVLAGLLAVAISLQFTLFPRPGEADTLLQRNMAFGNGEPVVLWARYVGPPPDAVPVPDKAFPPPIEAPL